MAQTAKEQYDELVNSLKSGAHTYEGRDVLGYDEYDGTEGAQAGKRVVAIQYAGKDNGGGGLLREYAFDPAELAAQPEAEAESSEAESSEKPSRATRR